MQQTTRRIEQVIGLAALCLLLIGCFAVMRPFLSAAMWAVVLAFSLWPVHRWLTRALGDRRTLAAFLTTLSIMLVLVIPFVAIGVGLADDVRALGAAARRWLEAGPPAPPSWLVKVPVVGRQAESQWKELAAEGSEFFLKLKEAAAEAHTLSETNSAAVLPQANAGPAADGAPVAQESRLFKAFKSFFSWARKGLLRAGLALGHGVLEVSLSVFLTFFLLRDGAALADRLTVSLLRIAGDRARHLLEVAGNTVRGVVYGILGTALVQGLAAGVGFLIAGVPGAALLGLLTFFLSVVPMGPPLVWGPAVIWLYSQGNTGWAIFMAIWGLGVSSIDNVVKPWLISQGSAMPFILIFFGVIGGALAFGVIGVFLGPTLLAVAYRLIEEWSTVSAETAAD